MRNHILDEATIGTAKVVVDLLGKGKVLPGTTITPTAICLHNTGNIGAPAKNNHNYMRTCNKNGDRIASWCFTVDDKEIWQACPANWKCYHAGTSKGNNTSISIEICMFNDKERQRKAYMNAIELVKILMTQYNIDIKNVKQHYDYSKKDCPTWLRSGKFGYTWSWFKNQLVVPDNKDDGTFLVKVLVDELNIRTGPSTDYRVVGQVHKDEVYTIIRTQGSWAFLKSQVGWININPKYVKKL